MIFFWRDCYFFKMELRSNLAVFVALEGSLIVRTRPLVLALFVLMGSIVAAQDKAAPSHSRPAPHIAGRFIDFDGTHLRLHYVRNARAETFMGVIQSTCMLPADSASAESKPLDLSKTPIGTEMTAYYVRHKVDKNLENVIMAVRFDHVQGQGSTLPVGVYIPCFKPAENPAPKP